MRVFFLFALAAACAALPRGRKTRSGRAFGRAMPVPTGTRKNRNTTSVAAEARAARKRQLPARGAHIVPPAATPAKPDVSNLWGAGAWFNVDTSECDTSGKKPAEHAGGWEVTNAAADETDPALVALKGNSMMQKIVKRAKASMRRYAILRKPNGNDLDASFGTSCIYMSIGCDEAGNIKRCYVGQQRDRKLHKCGGHYGSGVDNRVGIEGTLGAEHTFIHVLGRVEGRNANAAEGAVYTASFIACGGRVDNIMCQIPPSGAQNLWTRTNRAYVEAEGPTHRMYQYIFAPKDTMIPLGNEDWAADHGALIKERLAGMPTASRRRMVEAGNTFTSDNQPTSDRTMTGLYARYYFEYVMAVFARVVDGVPLPECYRERAEPHIARLEASGMEFTDDGETFVVTGFLDKKPAGWQGMLYPEDYQVLCDNGEWSAYDAAVLLGLVGPTEVPPKPPGIHAIVRDANGQYPCPAGCGRMFARSQDAANHARGGNYGEPCTGGTGVCPPCPPAKKPAKKPTARKATRGRP
eukprot:CAMPEP_0119270142 /NCGR_PEP_ID=MMETSP1329-20130426/7264_1 /TAXON_ID=114041 /ORGANISM="Genus nov. species nov., Strain RCC1024" /LENGTH=522 /DNA_ID=CAMNT_0007270151 /DNA_START=79 /DNA_END=1643 /DNA_ORIENTATION=-